VTDALPRVGVLTLEVTHRCRRRCAFCYVAGLRRADAPALDELPAAELVRIAASLARATGCQQVQLSGGEPLLRTDLLDLVAGLRGHGLGVSILTDAGTLDAERARALAALGVGRVQPTLLAGSAAVHDALRGAGAFQETTRGLAVAAAAGLPVTVSFVITAANHAAVTEAGALAFALGARVLGLARLCPAGAAASARARLLPTPADVRRAFERAADLGARLGLKVASVVAVPRCVFADPARPPVPLGPCSLVGPATTLTLGPDGTVRSCSMSTTGLGDARREPPEVILARLASVELAPHRAAVAGLCLGCPERDRCLGGCRLSAVAAGTGRDPLASGWVGR
jgi:pyrroloquinoline quinone biosynthesis protein E